MPDEKISAVRVAIFVGVGGVVDSIGGLPRGEIASIDQAIEIEVSRVELIEDLIAEVPQEGGVELGEVFSHSTGGVGIELHFGNDVVGIPDQGLLK